MILTDADALDLKKRLIAQLEPICDAEPSVLADYVIALLKHDKEDQELMDLCASQLQDFLREDTKAFLEDLFKFLKVKSNSAPADYNDRLRDKKRNRKEQKPYKRGTCRDYSGYCVRDGCRYEHVDSRSRSGKMEEDGYDPENPGMVIEKTRNKSQQQQQRHLGHKKNYRLKKDTLVVEKIPPESCSLEKIHEYFKKFGAILNVSIDKNQLKAVIQYETIAGAQDAHSCPDSIFGNRFVKAYFLREFEENGLRSSNGLDSKDGSNAQPSVVSMDVEFAKPPQQVFYEKGKQLIELQRNQDAIIAQQIEASKVLMSQLLLPDISPNEKKVILEQLKVLQGSTQSLVEKASEHTRMLKLSTASSQDDLERQRLDRELEVLNQMAAVSDEATTDAEVDPELKSKLEALKAEARALGIPGYSPSPRGRGRGGKYPRGGRCGRSLRLDNRSKKLLVTGVSENFQSALNEHCQTLTGIESITPQTGRSAIISFFSRVEAEAAVLKPIKIEGLEGVQVQWVPGDSLSNPPSAMPTSADPSGGESLHNWDEDEEDGDASWKRR